MVGSFKNSIPAAVQLEVGDGIKPKAGSAKQVTVTTPGEAVEEHHTRVLSNN